MHKWAQNQLQFHVEVGRRQDNLCNPLLKCYFYLIHQIFSAISSFQGQIMTGAFYDVINTLKMQMSAKMSQISLKVSKTSKDSSHASSLTISSKKLCTILIFCKCHIFHLGVTFNDDVIDDHVGGVKIFFLPM